MPSSMFPELESPPLAAAAPADYAASILLVDDQHRNLLALDAILGDLPLNVVTATSGQEALRQVLRQDFALILMDVMMPDMDGFETAELIRQRKRSQLMTRWRQLLVTSKNRLVISC